MNCSHGDSPNYLQLLFQSMYHASFIILYYDQQMHTITSQTITLLHVWHCRVTLRELVINTLPRYTGISNAAVGNTIFNVKHLNWKLYYQQLHLKYLCNLARYWLQVPWGWHDSVETCRSVIICEIIVHLLLTVQNNKKKSIQSVCYECTSSLAICKGVSISRKRST